MANQGQERLTWFQEILRSLITVLLFVFLIRGFIAESSIVEGASMEPNLRDNERVLIDKITPNWRPYQRGEVAVFFLPFSGQYLIKRIIGLPGERIVITSGTIRIFNTKHPNGFQLDESEYALRSDTNVLEYSMGRDEYFVMGDNRPNSQDSRYFGPVKKDLFLGRVVMRGFPFNRISIFQAPKYPGE